MIASDMFSHDMTLNPVSTAILSHSSIVRLLLTAIDFSDKMAAFLSSSGNLLKTA